MSARQQALSTGHDHPVLGQVALGYCPMIDRQRSVIATRLTVFPDRPDAVCDVPALLAAIDGVWPADGAEAQGGAVPRPLDPGAVSSRTAATRPPLALNVAGEALLRSVMEAAPGPALMLEIPAFMAADPAHRQTIRTLRDAGSVLLIKGRPTQPLAPEVLACFSHSIVDVSDERRGSAPPPPGQQRSVTSVQSGVRTTAELEQALERGAVAVLGWTFDDAAPKPSGRTDVPPQAKVVLDLIDGIERDRSNGQLEDILKRDPTLGYRLMRYLNSAAFGLQVEIASFGHALMLLGRNPLKRWLTLLLASSSKDPNAKPNLYAAVRRGLLMEELARAGGGTDTAMQGEMFVCGVFSLLDRLLGRPLPELLAGVPVPERVRDALLADARGDDDAAGSPYRPYLALVRAIENAAVFDIRELSERVLLGRREVNRALLASLAAARRLD